MGSDLRWLGNASIPKSHCWSNFPCEEIEREIPWWNRGSEISEILRNLGITFESHHSELQILSHKQWIMKMTAWLIFAFISSPPYCCHNRFFLFFHRFWNRYRLYRAITELNDGALRQSEITMSDLKTCLRLNSKSWIDPYSISEKKFIKKSKKSNTISF